jgi:effector-binding domain-containing protein
MKKIIIIVIALAVVVIAVFLFFTVFMAGPDLSQYEFLKTPRITTLENRKVLEVEIEGNAEEVLPEAFSLLYSTYFKIPDVPKGPNQPAPLLRCEIPVDKPVSEYSNQTYVANQTWHIGIPVPELTTLPDTSTAEDMTPRISTWEYGEVAEILHIGPYEKELPTIEQLEAYVKSGGYRFRGIHEEEYLKGPGMPFSKPEDYYTIIRYLVEKAD